MGKLYRVLKRSLRNIKRTEYEKRTNRIDFKSRLLDIYCAFMDTWIYSWLSPITVFRECLVRTARWLPIIWKDRHWDHGFILEILRHKIRFTRECIGKYNRHTTVEEDCRNMKIAEFLIKRIQDDNYYDWMNREHDEKWGKLDWSCEGRNKDNILFDNKFSNSGLTRSGIKSQKDWEAERKEHRRIGEYAKYMKNQDYIYLFKHLHKHLECWWD